MNTFVSNDKAAVLDVWFRTLRWVFLIAALWNLCGGIPGVLFPADLYAREFGTPLNDPVFTAIYRGAWGTSLLYGLGFLIVATNPLKHWGIVVMGGLGKALFALNLCYMYANGWTSRFSLLVILGDLIFVLTFILYLRALWSVLKVDAKERLIT